MPLTRAISSGHQFVYDDLNDYLNLAHARIAKVVASIAIRTG